MSVAQQLKLVSTTILVKAQNYLNTYLLRSSEAWKVNPCLSYLQQVKIEQDGHKWPRDASNIHTFLYDDFDRILSF